RTAGGRRRAHPRPRGRGRAGAAVRSRRLVGDRRGHGDPPRDRGDGSRGGGRGARGERALVRAAGRRERDDLDELRARGEAAPLMAAVSADGHGRAALLARVDGRLPELRPAERRGAQQLGFAGFHELKAVLARELAGSSPPAERIDAQPDARLTALAQVTAAGAASVRDAGALVDAGVFEASVAALDRAQRVLVVGVGSSAALCKDAASRFTAIGLHVEAAADVHEQHLRARLLRTGDACLVLSHTGTSRETLAAARAAVAGGASTTAITSFAISPLVELVDHALVVGTRTLAPHLAPLATRLAHLALVDSLVVAVALRDEPRTRRALARHADGPP